MSMTQLINEIKLRRAATAISPANLNQFVRRCCYRQHVDPQEVIDRLLAVENEYDIINRLVPANSLRLHIGLWITNGKPYYSGNELS